MGAALLILAGCVAFLAFLGLKIDKYEYKGPVEKTGKTTNTDKIVRFWAINHILKPSYKE
jgi:hypothetical protein